jgi:hypothetical protein
MALMVTPIEMDFSRFAAAWLRAGNLYPIMERRRGLQMGSALWMCLTAPTGNLLQSVSVSWRFLKVDLGEEKVLCVSVESLKLNVLITWLCMSQFLLEVTHNLTMHEGMTASFRLSEYAWRNDCEFSFIRPCVCVCVCVCVCERTRAFILFRWFLILWSSNYSSWLEVQRSWVRCPALPYFLTSSGSGTGSTQPYEDKWGATWMKSRVFGLENRK